MKVILSHSGKQHSYHVARAMKNIGLLETFYTSSYVKERWLQNFFLKTNNNYFTRRFISGLNGQNIQSNWHFEVKEIVVRKLFGKTKKAQNAVYNRDVKFDNYVAREIKRRSTKCNGLKDKIFWGFQGSCHDSLIAARQAGMITVIELATAHVTAAQRILGEEKELHPEWADSIDNLYFPPAYEQRLKTEPHLADFVVAASEFTKSTLLEIGIPSEKIIYLPLGVDTSSIEMKKNIEYKKPLKLLYAGTVTQRKGIKYLLKALEGIDQDELKLHIYGHIQGSGNAFKKFSSKVHYHGPVSQLELFKLYKDFDYLVLPSVFEGFGLVIVEAMAAGLPVITTRHTFGAELIEYKKNGFLTEIRSIIELKEIFSHLLQISNEEYLKMSVNAREAANTLTWDAYEKNLEQKLNENILPYTDLKATC